MLRTSTQAPATRSAVKVPECWTRKRRRPRRKRWLLSESNWRPSVPRGKRAARWVLGLFRQLHCCSLSPHRQPLLTTRAMTSRRTSRNRRTPASTAPRSAPTALAASRRTSEGVQLRRKRKVSFTRVLDNDDANDSEVCTRAAIACGTQCYFPWSPRWGRWGRLRDGPPGLLRGVPTRWRDNLVRHLPQSLPPRLPWAWAGQGPRGQVELPALRESPVSFMPPSIGSALFYFIK